MKTAVVIPSWNGIDYLGPCLRSLNEQSRQADVVVVDNGSRDGSAGLVKTHYPNVHLIELEKNYGFAGGVNRGIEWALEHGYEAVALLNNDAEAAINWLEVLIPVLENNPEAGIVTGKILSMDKKTLDSTGDFYSVWGVPFPRGRGEADDGQYDGQDKRAIFAGSGGASIYRADMLHDVGLFDEAFFAYYEDVDISFRAQLAGWKVLYEPGARVYHHIGATSGKLGDFRLFHMYKNFVFLFIKNMPKPLFRRYIWKVIGTFGFKKLQLMKHLKFGLLFKLIGAVMKQLPAMFRQRKEIQQRMRVDSEYIDSLLYHQPPPSQPRLNKLTSRRHR